MWPILRPTIGNWNLVRGEDDISVKDGVVTRTRGHRRASYPGPRPSHEEFGSSLSARAMPSAESPLCKAFHSVRAAESSNSTPSYSRIRLLWWCWRRERHRCCRVVFHLWHFYVLENVAFSYSGRIKSNLQSSLIYHVQILVNFYLFRGIHNFI